MMAILSSILGILIWEAIEFGRACLHWYRDSKSGDCENPARWALSFTWALYWQGKRGIWPIYMVLKYRLVLLTAIVYVLLSL